MAAHAGKEKRSVDFLTGLELHWQKMEWNKYIKGPVGQKLMNKTGTLQPHTSCGMPATLHILAIEALGLTPPGISSSHSQIQATQSLRRLADHPNGHGSKSIAFVGPCFQS